MTTAAATLRLDGLLDGATAKTGLTDFGDDWFTEPLRVLATSLNDEARLTGLGFELTRRRLVSLLCDRLRLRQLQREHPAIRDVEVRVAAEICGLPRTGSTLLHRLLASAPGLTTTLSWETSYPLPFPGEGADAGLRKEKARAQMELFLQHSPDFKDIHTVAWDAPEEDVILVDRSFTSMSFESFYWVPSYGDWLRAADQTRAYAELYEWLQALQWQDPARAGKHWVLKSPHHLCAVGTVLDAFPGCKIIMTHRSPVKAVPSYASMVHSLGRQYSDAIDPRALGPYWSNRFAQSLSRLAQVRDERPERFIDVRFDSMMTEPVTQAVRVLTELGLPADDATGAAFGSFISRDREERSASHSYAPADFGLSVPRLETDFAFYTEEYL